ncbi:hypothetical protein HDC92_000432 [Pedobacter sp. AK017]|uniref:DUF5017 domain-containing protein n=1 Tax=Pedobacter sp. AK017 TaxID=2723073 RepID=UPI00160E51DD|nr:DUF5017 domain-containing protein [Pedobacter sp. AK017]MBB5436768.1 hypothetical protein [Pedobacter sp. AK017]
MKHNQLKGKLVLLLVLFTISCKKNEVPQPSFDVKVPKSTYRVGEPVPFTFDGNPDFISFYSGQFGNDYAFSNGRIMDIKTFSMSFQTRLQAGGQNKQLSVLISSNYNGEKNISAVNSASWTDLTSSFSFSLTTLDYFSSGELNLSSIVTDKTKPLYVAFRYITLPQTTANGVYRNTVVRNFLFNTKTDAGTSVAMDQLSAGWSLLEEGPILESGRNSVNASSGLITLRGNITAAGKLVQTEIWAISKPVNLNAIDLGPDRGTAIKGISDPVPSVYNFTYTTPGTYKVVFSAANSRLYGEKSITKEANITITP